MNLVGDLRYVPASEFASFAGPEDTKLRDEAWQGVLAQEPAAARAEFDTAFPAGFFARRQAFFRLKASTAVGCWASPSDHGQ